MVMVIVQLLQDQDVRRILAGSKISLLLLPLMRIRITMIIFIVTMVIMMKITVKCL